MMAWEHLVLGNDLADLGTECALLAELGRAPRDADPGIVRDRYPGAEPLRLPGSGLVITTGELNVLADYFAHPDAIAAAPVPYLLHVIQSVRSQSLVQLRRLAPSAPRRGRASLPGARLPGSPMPGALRYSRRRRMSELREAIALTRAGRRSGLPEPDRYPSLIARNAAHFAPFSWYRWQAFHLEARAMILRSATLAPAGRERLRAKARLYAGYADHFLQDSFAAGHLANKTLVMQWYAEWLDRRAAITCLRQPLLHGPGLYYPQADRAADQMRPAQAATDPQTMVELASLEERIRVSGIAGRTSAERHDAYLAYLRLLGDASAQFASGVVHGYLNRRSLTVASRPDAHAYRIWGDRTMFTPAPNPQPLPPPAFTPASNPPPAPPPAAAAAPTTPAPAAAAARASRQAISELLATGRTAITTCEIFEQFPRYVYTSHGPLSLPQWHQTVLRDLCLRELFGRWDTRAVRLATTLHHPDPRVPRDPRGRWPIDAI